MIVHDNFVAVEEVRSEFIGLEDSLAFFCFLLLVSLPLNVVGSRDRVADIFQRFEQVGLDSALDVGLELPR